MKLQDLKLDEWDGTYEEVEIFDKKNERILLLHLVNLNGLKTEGRRNLVKVNNFNDIIWIAEVPKIGRSIGWYTRCKIEHEVYEAWYGGSVLVEIDPKTGIIIKEHFIR